MAIKKNKPPAPTAKQTSKENQIVVHAYYDRKKDSIEGLFTLIVNGKEVFKQLPARSGQRFYENTNFVSGKSPIPLLGKKTEYQLVTKAVDNGEVIPKGGGIGRFYPICTDIANPMVIRFPEGSRFAIGLHPENRWPGSAGCIVLLVNTPQRERAVRDLFLMLDNLHTKGVNNFPLTVL